MMVDEYGGFCIKATISKDKVATPAKQPLTRTDTMSVLHTQTDFNEWLAIHGNPHCKQPSRYPAFAVMNGRKPAVYGLIQFNNNLIADLRIWRLISNYHHLIKAYPDQHYRIMLKAIVMNKREGLNTRNNLVMEPDHDVTHLLVDLLSGSPKYCFDPQRFVDAVPNIGEYANLKVWSWRIGLEITPLRQ
jgi:hypothetical protein